MTTIHPIYRAGHGLDDAAVELLGCGRLTIFGTEDPDGSVHLTPVMYLFDAGRVHIETSSASRKARNVLARPRATVLVLDHRIGNSAWVSGTGPAELIRGEEADRIGRRIRSRYLTERGEQEYGSVLARYDDAAIVVTPRSWMTWDTSALDATLVAHGLRSHEAEDWYLPTPS